MYSCHLFLVFSASARFIPFLSFIEPILSWNVRLVSLIFLKRSLVFPIPLFLYFFALITEEGFLISPCYSLVLCIQMGITFLFSLSFTSLFSAMCKAFSDNRFAVLQVFFLRMVLLLVSCTMSWTSVHSSSGTLSYQIYFLNLSTLKSISHLHCIIVAAAAAAKWLQSCPTLCDPIDGSPPGFPVPGILQARTLEWVAISFSNASKWKVKVKSFSCVQLFVTPWTAAYQAPPSMGFSRQEYLSGLPLPSPI